jgi:5'-nucleotidase
VKRPLILVTNDDGYNAPGINHLIEFVKEIAEVVVVAPDSPQSGMGHAITIDSTLEVHRLDLDGAYKGLQAYSTSGTPADCVKLALHEILDRKPDLVVSGINHGANSSINVIYSGTMSAAIEAGVEGIPAIGFSLLDYSWSANFEACKNVVQTLVKEALNKGIPSGTVLNVNIPKTDGAAVKGMRVCRQAKANWKERFDKRVSPTGKEYYWLTGDFILLDEGEDTDIAALEAGYVSIVPTQFDLTAHHSMAHFNSWKIH